MPGDVVRVRVTKYDGSPHRDYLTVRLGADEHGIWLGLPVAVFRVGNAVLLCPPGETWTALFWESPRRVDIYCDITTPVLCQVDTVTMVDLDLDVCRRWPSGEVFVADEDEFDEAIPRLGYPDDLVAAARDTVTRLRTAMAARIEPFGEVGWRWVDQFAKVRPSIATQHAIPGRETVT